MAVTISKCKTKKEWKLFEQVPELIHRDEKFYVPPFPGTIVKIVKPGGSFSSHGEIVGFLATRDGEPVGRIAAIENRSHNNYNHEKTGFFGYFDFINDIEVARALWNAAAAELKNRGLDSIKGPCNPSTNEECGVLAEGFDSIPSVMMPYNPPYYLEIYEKLGLKPNRNLFAFYLSTASGVPERIGKVVERIKRSTGITLRSVRMDHLDEDLRIFRDLYNETLIRNPDFLPITLEDLEFLAQDLKPIADPDLILIAEKNGVPAGFSLCLPNIHEFLWKIRSSRSVLARILRFVWLLKTSRPRELRLIVLGVKPEFLNSGLGALFYFESLTRGRAKNYLGGELSWIEESNKEIIKGITLMGGQKYKTYRMYEGAMPA